MRWVKLWYCPTSHSEQFVWRKRWANLPAGQCTQDVLAGSGWKVPSSQPRHTSAACPLCAMYLPGMQAIQPDSLSSFFTLLHLPAMQWIHPTAPLPGLYCPSAQLTQSLDPVSLFHRPALHTVQLTCCFSPWNKPELHSMQDVCACPGWNLPVSQSMQLAAADSC